MPSVKCWTWSVRQTPLVFPSLSQVVRGERSCSPSDLELSSTRQTRRDKWIDFDLRVSCGKCIHSNPLSRHGKTMIIWWKLINYPNQVMGLIDLLQRFVSANSSHCLKPVIPPNLLNHLPSQT